MISLELSQDAPVDQTKLFLLKGRKVAVCHSCQKSCKRPTLFVCEHCKHGFCQGCIDACKCQSKPFRVNLSFWKRRSAPAPVRKLALVR